MSLSESYNIILCHQSFPQEYPPSLAEKWRNAADIVSMWRLLGLLRGRDIGERGDQLEDLCYILVSTGGQ